MNLWENRLLIFDKSQTISSTKWFVLHDNNNMKYLRNRGILRHGEIVIIWIKEKMFGTK